VKTSEVLEELENVVDATKVIADPRTQDVEFHSIENIDVGLVDPNPWNPNEQDEKTFNRLVQEIKDVGFLEPIHVAPYEDEGTGATRYLIIGGEHRWRAAQAAGMPKIPALLLKHKRFSDLDFQKAMTIRLNALRGKLNKDKMVRLFQDFADRYSSEEVRNMFAFTDKGAWERIVGDMKKGLKQSGMPAELVEEFDKNAQTARTVEDLGKIIQHLYETYSDTVPFGFMVFTYAKQEHIYIAATKRAHAALQKILDAAEHRKVDVNEILTPALEAAAEGLGELTSTS
jgi:hypothetical protein